MASDVLIVGAGPVGLLLACRLKSLGVTVQVIDERDGPAQESRAIGIHAPSLELVQELGLWEAFTAAGVLVNTGIAASKERELGRLQLGRHGGSVLVLPQSDTERLLERRFEQLAPGCLRRAVRLVGLECRPDKVQALVGHRERSYVIDAGHVVGCDGARSTTRGLMGVAVRGGAYPDRFAMGDFDDDTDLADRACIFLGPSGMVESFPLPRAGRRWVLRDFSEHAVDVAEFRQWVQHRTGHSLRGNCRWGISRFGTEHQLAYPLVSGRVVLAGDAAHVMSPIGGQGMNVGWLGAWELATALAAAQQREDSELLTRYQHQALRRASLAIRRAERNMLLGASTRWNAVRNALVRAALHAPLERLLVDAFSMRRFALKVRAEPTDSTPNASPPTRTDSHESSM